MFTPIRHLTTPDDAGHSRITDLQIIRTGGVDVLVSITRYDGKLQSWDIAGPAITSGAMLALEGGDLPGGSGSIVTQTGAGGPSLLIGGGADGAYQQVGLVNGEFQVLETLPVPAGFQHGLAVAQGDGGQIVYGGMAGTTGIAALQFDVNGTFAGQADQIATSGPVAAITMAGSYVATAEQVSDRLTLWQTGPGGGLAQTATLSPEDNLWIAAPTALGTAVVDGVTYLVLAAAGSNSLSVIEIGPQGDLIIRDHLLDTLHTRFGGVTALDIVTEGGRSYVIAGGADDGISVFTLLPGGQLVALAPIADTTSIGLDNVSAIAARGRGGGLDIFVASSSEPGVTQLRLDTGPAGETRIADQGGGVLAGTGGNDILLGGAGDDAIMGGHGDDILRDGSGSDVMTGGAGADLFILSRDGALDIITDFTLGEDRLDLSLWPMLRDISQLTMSMTATGMRIQYGDEDLIIHSTDGAPIDYRLLTNADVLGGGSRLPDVLTPGFAGPDRPPPDLTGADAPPAADPGGPYSLLSGYRALASGNMTDLRSALQGQPAQDGAVVVGSGAAGSLIGRAGENALIAGNRGDTLIGNGGDDLLIGRGGNDVLIGGDGADILIGGAGSDDLRGGDGNDLLIGGDGDDRLAGGRGNDVMIGGAGADTFVFSQGADQILDFDQGIDRIILDARLWTGLTSAADLLLVHGQWEDDRAMIDFGAGDILWINGVTDFAAFADDISLF